MKKKRTLIQSIKKDIYKGFIRIKWFGLTKFNFLLRSFFLKKKIKKNKISLLIPSKQRVDKLSRLINSLLSKTTYIDRIYILVLIDENEKDKEDYLKLILEFEKKVNIKIFVKDEKTHNIRNNYLAEQIDSDLYFPMNDDVIFIMNNWDTYIDTMESYTPNNKPYSIWCKTDRKYPYLHSDFPIVNKLWYKKLGYIGNLHLYGYIDTWICELSKITKLFILSNKQFLDHLNVENSNNNDVPDKTYKDLMVAQSNDLKIWQDTKNIRIKDAKKLI